MHIRVHIHISACTYMLKYTYTHGYRYRSLMYIHIYTICQCTCLHMYVINIDRYKLMYSCVYACTQLFLHRLKRLVTVIMDQYRIDHLSGAFLFGVDESLTSMMDRAHSKGVI